MMIEVVIDAEAADPALPSTSSIENVVLATCGQAGFNGQPELCVRFAADAEIRMLNKQWRGLDVVTDVLSFPMQDGPDYNLNEPLGDIALAAPFIAREAERLGLPMHDHALHLITHAVLHLLGFDHVRSGDAATMQQLEQQIMQHLDLHDPYPNDAIAGRA